MRRSLRSLVIVLGAVLIIAGIAAVAWNSISRARAALPAYGPDDLATVRRGTLVATVSATGSIQPAASSSLAFTSGGNLAETFVKQGDRVQAGQPLARLDATELQLQLAQAEANLTLAQSKLNQLKRGGTETALAAAEANVASAQAAYDKLLRPDPNEVAMAKTDLEKARAALDQAQSAYDRVGGATNPNIGMLPQSLQLQTATQDYQKALAAYNAKFNPTDAQLKAAQAQLQSARDQLARLTPSGDDVTQAQANVDAMAAARDLAKQRLAQATLVAPYDGTIVTLSVEKGDFIQPGQAVATIADLNRLQIKLDIDETDIPRVALGQTVGLELDAYPGQTIEGRVTDIAPGSSTVQGVVNYAVRIDVVSTDLPLKIGMTANANIEVARKDNVLLIPNRAIRAENGKRLVTVLEAGGTREVQVSLGLSNDQETEALSGVSEGDQLVTAVIAPTLSTFGQPRSSSDGK